MNGIEKEPSLAHVSNDGRSSRMGDSIHANSLRNTYGKIVPLDNEGRPITASMESRAESQYDEYNNNGEGEDDSVTLTREEFMNMLESETKNAIGKSK